jgi:hypothetical protein
MQKPVKMQGLLTLKGQGVTTAVKFHGIRRNTLWVGDAQCVAMTVEVLELTAAITPPTLRIETALCLSGPWQTIASYTTPGDRVLYLRREPGGTPAQQVLGFLKWSIEETSLGGAWTACFRISAAMEELL